MLQPDMIPSKRNLIGLWQASEEMISENKNPKINFGFFFVIVKFPYCYSEVSANVSVLEQPSMMPSSRTVCSYLSFDTLPAA